MTIRGKPLQIIRTDIDPRLLERSSSDFEATAWRGRALARSNEQRFPYQPPMPAKHPDLAVFRHDPIHDLPGPLTLLNHDFWRRALAVSNQAAVARYIANARQHEEVTEELVYRSVDFMREIESKSRTEIIHHDSLRRIELFRNAALMARMTAAAHAELIEELYFRRLGRMQNERLRKWNEEQQKILLQNAANRREAAIEMTKIHDLATAAQRGVDRQLATAKYQALAEEREQEWAAHERRQADLEKDLFTRAKTRNPSKAS